MFSRSRDLFPDGLPELEGGDILIVDDMLPNLNLLGALLKSRGHHVRAASSGQVALEAVASKPPEVILLDIEMPGMDGFEVCRALKEHPRHRDIPVVFLTVQTSTQDKLRAFREGGADYITKPFDAEEVHMRVRHQLAIHRLRSSLEQHVAQLEAAHRRARLELEAVLHAKRAFMPAGCVSVPGAQACCADVLGADVAGDLMSLTSTNHHRIAAFGVNTGDRGPGAAVVAASLAARMEEAAHQPAADPSAVVGQMLGDQLVGSKASKNAFACCLYDAKARKAVCASSDPHWPFLVLAPAAGEPREAPLSSGGLVKVDLAPGDRLYLAGTGLEKLRDPRGEAFGAERFLGAARDDRGAPLRQAVDAMARRMVDFAHPALPALDFPLMAIEAAA